MFEQSKRMRCLLHLFFFIFFSLRIDLFFLLFMFSSPCCFALPLPPPIHPIDPSFYYYSSYTPSSCSSYPPLRSPHSRSLVTTSFSSTSFSFFCPSASFSSSNYLSFSHASPLLPLILPFLLLFLFLQVPPPASSSPASAPPPPALVPATPSPSVLAPAPAIPVPSRAPPAPVFLLILLLPLLFLLLLSRLLLPILLLFLLLLLLL